MFPRYNGVRNVTVHANLLKFAKLVPDMYDHGFLQHLHRCILVSGLEVHLPFLVVNRVESRGWEHLEALAASGRHVPSLGKA